MNCHLSANDSSFFLCVFLSHISVNIFYQLACRFKAYTASVEHKIIMVGFPPFTTGIIFIMMNTVAIVF